MRKNMAAFNIEIMPKTAPPPSSPLETAVKDLGVRNAT